MLVSIISWLIFLGWLPTKDEINVPDLNGERLSDAVHAKCPSANGFDWWSWKDFKALPIGWDMLLPLGEDLSVSYPSSTDYGSLFS